MQNNADAIFSRNSENWETPDEIFKKYDDIYHFTLDVCADESNHKCERYFTKNQDGLKQNWDGEICWCNPPYGRKIAKFVEKAYLSNALTVMFIPAMVDTKWFHSYIYKQHEIEFIPGRVRFKGAMHNAPFPSMIVIFDNRKDPKRKIEKKGQLSLF